MVLLVSCSKNDGNYQWQTISKTEAFNFLHYTNNIHGMFVARNVEEMTSDSYCVPSVEWIEQVYRPALKSFVKDNGVWMPSTPDNNCVKFSSYGYTVGHILHAKGEGPRQTSLAIGIVDYSRELFLWHSINLFIAHDEYGGLKLYYLEPQDGTQVKNDEVNSQWWAVRM